MTMARPDSLNSLQQAFSRRDGLRRLFVFSTIALASMLFFPLRDFPSSSLTGAQTQMQLNKEACDEYKKADAEMNDIYRRITRDYRQNAGFIAALKKAQLAWISYRDAHLESIFPGDPSQYGSISQMCRCTNLAEITRERTQALKRWIDGVEEGDVCAGSVKVK